MRKINILLVFMMIMSAHISSAQSKKKMIKENTQTVDAFFVALETENFENLRNIFTTDAKQLNPYVPEGFPKEYVGSEGIYKQYSGLPKLFSGMRFPRKIMATEDPNVFFVTFKGEIDIREGGTYQNDYIGIFKLRDGKIYEYTEYFNPIVMAKAFGVPLN